MCKKDRFIISLNTWEIHMIETSLSRDVRFDEVLYIHSFSILAERNEGLPISDWVVGSMVQESWIIFLLLR